MHPSHLIHAPKIHFPSIKHLPHIGQIHIPAPHIQAPHINIPKLHIKKPISFKEFIGGTNSVQNMVLARFVKVSAQKEKV